MGVKMSKLFFRIISLNILMILLCSTILSQALPEVFYYRFKNNNFPYIHNYGVPGRGNLNAQIIGHQLGPDGEFDTCLIGKGGVNDYINTGWTPNIGYGNWTISFWLNGLEDRNPTYLFGNVASGNFRCFYGGAAGNGNIMLRGNFADVIIHNVMPGPTVIHMVYNGSQVRVYKNGVKVNTFNRTGININGGGPFQVAGFRNRNCFNDGAKMDEFRYYDRALSDYEISITWNKELGVVTGINEDELVPKNFELKQNYPNPFNPDTRIKYKLPKESFVVISIFDMLGREVAVLVNENQTIGTHEVVFNGDNLPSGAYLCKMTAGNFTDSKKMVLVK